MRRSLLTAPLLALLSLGGCSNATPTIAAAPVPVGPSVPAGVTPASIAMGDSIFNTGACQRCHGLKGVGAQNGPSLVAGPWLHSTGKFEEIAAVITTGVARTALNDQTRRFPMNPRGGPMNLSDDQVNAVAAYVYSISRDRR